MHGLKGGPMKKFVPFLVLGLAVWLMLEPSALSQGIITLETSAHPINLTALDVSTWPKEGMRVFVAVGDVRIVQGKVLISADSAAFLFYEQEALSASGGKEARGELYCEGKVSLIQDKDVQQYEQLFVRLETTAGIVVNSFSDIVKTYNEEQPLVPYLRALKLKELGRGEFTSTEPSQLAVGVPGEIPVVDIVADDIDTWVEDNTRIVTALGNVVVKKADTTLEADNAILWFEEEELAGRKKQTFKEFYAEGNVVLHSREDVIRADKAFQNITEKKGIFINPRMKTKVLYQKTLQDVYMEGEEAKLIEDGMLLTNASFTSCSFGHPHYRFRSRDVTITRRRTPLESYSEMVARHNTFLVGDIPLAYWPRYTYDTRTKAGLFKGISWGSGTRTGTFVSSTWDPLALGLFMGVNRWSDLIVKLDYLALRGPAGGADFSYKRLNMEGDLETYFIKDSLERDKNATNALVEHENRGRVLWRHRQHLNKYWRADAELSYLSDRGFLREFYEKEFKMGKDQETDLYLRRLEDNRALTFLTKKQIHRFDTGLEALPQLSYQLISQPLWEDRLNFTSQSEIGYLDFQMDDELDVRDPTLYRQLQSTTGSSVRMDSNNTLGWPFQLWIWKLKPFVGSRITAYSKSLEAPGANDGPAVGRLATSLGLDGSTNFWRTYSLESKRLRIHKLRHIITPEFRWEAGPTVTADPDDLLQYSSFNPAAPTFHYSPTDGLDKYNAFIFGVRNRLQTRRGLPPQLRTVDLVDLDLEFHILPSPEDSAKFVTHTVGNAEGFLIPEKDSFLQIDFRSQLTDRLALVSERNEFNLAESSIDVFTVGTTFQNMPDWYSFLGYRFLKDTSSTVIFNTNTLINQKWRVGFSEQYDFRSEDFTGSVSSKNLHTSFFFAREAHEWTGMLILGFDTVNRNKAVTFTITPKGISRTFKRDYSSLGTP
jgi:lipopolysaccharide assembly outer membrane protein LptD (OstA)